ncbi:hypothetical protein ACOSP7_018688 [Xanthoceras sorbifolium]
MGLIEKQEEGPREDNYARSMKHVHNGTTKGSWLAMELRAIMWIRGFYLGEMDHYQAICFVTQWSMQIYRSQIQAIIEQNGYRNLHSCIPKRKRLCTYVQTFPRDEKKILLVEIYITTEQHTSAIKGNCNSSLSRD